MSSKPTASLAVPPVALRALREATLSYYRKSGRHDLPWRQKPTPYGVLVSELMLQQTQVARVVPKYRAFMRQFPTVRALASAPLGSVLTAWQGLGYNRRAKHLHEVAKAVVRLHGGRMPHSEAGLRELPGIGPYTASAVMAFAYDARTVLVETNVRTVFFHHLHLPEKVSDKALMTLVERALPAKGYRAWYSALMDYGAHLKASGVRTNARSTHYQKQSRFAGSLRQARGAILRALATGPAAKARLAAAAGERGEEALAALLAEGLVVRAGSRYRLPD